MKDEPNNRRLPSREPAFSPVVVDAPEGPFKTRTLAKPWRLGEGFYAVRVEWPGRSRGRLLPTTVVRKR